MKKIIFVFYITLINCAGSKGNLIFNKLNYPVSMTNQIIFKQNSNYSVNNYIIYEEFEVEENFCSTFYSHIAFHTKIDLSEKLNQEIYSKNGEGIINLKFYSKNHIVNYFWPLTALPFWIGCTTILIKGNVFKITELKN